PQGRMGEVRRTGMGVYQELRGATMGPTAEARRMDLGENRTGPEPRSQRMDLAQEQDRHWRGTGGPKRCPSMDPGKGRCCLGMGARKTRTLQETDCHRSDNSGWHRRAHL